MGREARGRDTRSLGARRLSVRFESEGPVAIITIDRPRVRNAVDSPTATQLAEAFRRFDQDPSLAVAVFTGAGGSFCAGWDLKALAAAGSTSPGPLQGGPMGPTWLQLQKPVIAAVEGFAVAGGLELALWCDLRVAARNAVFGVFNRRFGVPLVDGGTVRLPRLVGHGRALDMILTGRPVGAEEAHRIGLADRLTEPGAALAEALDLAQRLAAFPQAPMRSDRRSANEQWGLDTAAALENELGRGRATLETGADAIAGAVRFAAGAGRHGD